MFAQALLSASVFWAVVVTPASTPDGHLWKTYVNDRFGEAICYPADLVHADRAPDNDDGRSFTASNGARIATWGSYNALNQTLAASMEEDAQRLTNGSGNLTFRKTGPNFYVLSGHTGNQIFYNRTALVAGVFSTVEITYPDADRLRWNAVTARVSGCFRPARGPR